jgi:hypothetical protein
MSIIIDSPVSIVKPKRTRKPATPKIKAAPAVLPTLLTSPPTTADVIPHFTVGYDQMRADIAAQIDEWGCWKPVVKPVAPVVAPAPVSPAPIVSGRSTDFDVTRHDGTITAYNPKRGTTIRFKIESQDWRDGTKRVVSVIRDGVAINFGFASEYGITPFGPTSKCPLDMETRRSYASFLETLNAWVARGVEITVVRD